MTFAAIVLAAGAGARFGGGKMSALFRGEPLVAHAIRAARAAPVERVIVVAPPDLSTQANVFTVAIESDAMSTSLKAGIEAAEGFDGVFVFLGDMPLIPHDVAGRLAAILGDNFAAVPRFAGKSGHPVLFSAAAFPAIMRLEGDRGAGALLKGRDDIAFDDCTVGTILLDVDRSEDIARLERGPTVTDFSPLFTPFQLGKFTLPNRFVFPPMGLEVCENGIPGDDAAEYYARRAQGGASLVITEGAYIDHPASGDNPLLGRIKGEDSYEAWRNVATKVHREGGICVPELWHVGLIPSGPDLLAGKGIVYRPELGQVSPSGYIAPGQKVTEGMDQAQIDAVIAAYATSTAKAVELGFDGIELHGAHGYVIDQFLWKALNHRTDRYGGSARARGQFAAEVVRACREQLEPGMPIIMRMSFWKMADFNARLAETPQELEELLAPIVDEGVELFDCSQRRFWEPSFDDDSDLNLAGWVKRVTGVPTCTIGSIGLDMDFLASLSADTVADLDLKRLDELMRRFDRGDFDLIAVGRAMIAEPDWPKLVQAGALDQLKPFATSLMADPLMAHVK